MGEGMRMALKGSTPSAHARLKYITRQGKYAHGIDGPRTDLAQIGSGNLPNWAGDADQFWQGADQFERANARRCVELELNLPPELSLDQQRQVVEAYAERLLGAERLPHTWAIHDSGGVNPHCHLMFQERGLDGIDRPDAQAWFKRANAARPEQGGALKSRSIHGAAWTMHARATWAEAVNDGLRAAGHEPRFDHRSKAVQRDEALRNGDLRRAAALGTLTERHEGASVRGMRCRVERGEVELIDLPGYAQQLIQQNNWARAYNNALRDWARTAPDVELAERLAPELAELAEQLAQENPGAHIVVWQRHQQQLAAELEQAHTAAQVEWVERARARLIELRPATVRPLAVDRLNALKQQADHAAAEANAAEQARQVWRQEHPVRATMADALGKPLAVDLAAELAKRGAAAAAKALRSAPERRSVSEWQQSTRELKALEQQLPAMEQAAGLEPMHELEARAREALVEAARGLRKGVGLINNYLTWCTYDEREPLFALRRELEREQRELGLLRQLPAPEEAAQMRESAKRWLGQAEGWRESQDAVQALRQRELEKLRQTRPDDTPEPPPGGSRRPRMG
ncbi:Mobilization protein A [compost metagenome]